ncbi:MAG TPA: glycosyltransferase [Microthrixaceae bacterium]|nr:glycosyltransferase [Microthrixaceae bacterium]
MTSGVGDSPVVSVIIPVGAVDEFLPLQLDALSDQSFDQPWELVLSMNQPGSTTDPRILEHRVHPMATLLVVDSSATRSAAHARNAGAHAATADLLAFCDADDIVEPTWLESIVSALATDDVVGGHLDEQRLSPPGQERWRPPATPGELPSYLGHRYPVSANMGARRDAFDTIGGFPEGFTRCEDIAFGWLLADAGIDLGYAEDAVVHYRHRPGLWTMIRQHHFYGIGMTEVIERQGLPGGKAPSGMLAANGQRVTQRSIIHILRRGAIASGRLRGLARERSTRLGREEPSR